MASSYTLALQSLTGSLKSGLQLQWGMPKHYHKWELLLSPLVEIQIQNSKNILTSLGILCVFDILLPLFVPFSNSLKIIFTVLFTKFSIYQINDSRARPPHQPLVKKA